MNKKTVLPGLFFALLFALGPLTANAKSVLPPGCGTYVICKESKNGKGELEGPQVCVNARDDKITVIKANWRGDLLVGDFWCGSDEGEPRVKARYKDGLLDGDYQEYDSAQKDWALTQIYRAGKREGLSTRRLPDSGALTDVESYKQGDRVGTWREIGAVYEIELVYEKDNLVRKTVFDRTPAHKLMRRTEYMPDGSRKSEFKDPLYKEEDEGRSLD